MVVGCGAPPPASDNSAAAENASSAAEASASSASAATGRVRVGLETVPVASYWTVFDGCTRINKEAVCPKAVWSQSDHSRLFFALTQDSECDQVLHSNDKINAQTRP